MCSPIQTNVTWLLWGCSGFWLAGFLFQYGKNKDHAKEGDKGKTKKVKIRAKVHAEPEPPVPAEPPAPDVEPAPTPSEMEGRRAEAENL